MIILRITGTGTLSDLRKFEWIKKLKAELGFLFYSAFWVWLDSVEKLGSSWLSEKWIFNLSFSLSYSFFRVIRRQSALFVTSRWEPVDGGEVSGAGVCLYSPQETLAFVFNAHLFLNYIELYLFLEQSVGSRMDPDPQRKKWTKKEKEKKKFPTCFEDFRF